MEQWGGDNEINVNISGQKEVLEALIACFQTDIENSSVFRIETVLVTITKNLVFDDPGMIAKSLIFNAEERQIQDGTVMWLINQVIYVVNKHQRL